MGKIDDPSPVPGATYRQVDHWVRAGHLRPHNARAGSGRAREWPREELAVAELMARLVAAGFTVEAAGRYARLGLGYHEIGPGLFVEIGQEK